MQSEHDEIPQSPIPATAAPANTGETANTIESTDAKHSLDPRLNDQSEYQGCYACGLRNMAGLRLVFWQEGDEIVTEFTAEPHLQGFPGVVHGGILATLLDETLSRTAAGEGRWMMTGRLDVRYRSPAPVGRLLRVTARTLSSRARMVHAQGEIRLADDPTAIFAEARGVFLPIPKPYRQQAVERRPELAGFFDL